MQFLEPVPVNRLRGAFPHLLCNFVAHLRVEIRTRWGCLLGIEIGWSVIEARLF
jgi:hypothetical protein